MFRKSYNAKEQIVLIGPLGAATPLLDLADSDDCIQATMNEDMVEIDLDLNGNGRFIISSDESGQITLEIKNTSIADLARLSAYCEARLQLTCIIKDMTTNLAGVISQQCMIARQPDYARGKRPGNPQFTLKCIDLAIKHDGPTPIPV
ncbi:MAG: hypothetical protein OQK82_01325 [Candidatus Pacearchaeota archaeon]|nr:hypothetical protein [Candidatus Pacearchaeota archaeon]